METDRAGGQQIFWEVIQSSMETLFGASNLEL